MTHRMHLHPKTTTDRPRAYVAAHSGRSSRWITIGAPDLAGNTNEVTIFFEHDRDDFLNLLVDAVNRLRLSNPVEKKR